MAIYKKNLRNLHELKAERAALKAQLEAQKAAKTNNGSSTPEDQPMQWIAQLLGGKDGAATSDLITTLFKATSQSNVISFAMTLLPAFFGSSNKSKQANNERPTLVQKAWKTTRSIGFDILEGFIKYQGLLLVKRIVVHLIRKKS